MVYFTHYSIFQFIFYSIKQKVNTFHFVWNEYKFIWIFTKYNREKRLLSFESSDLIKKG